MGGSMKKIIAIKRESDIHVSLEGFSGAWGCGSSLEEAIGDLVSCHSGKFDIEIQWNNEDIITKRYQKSLG